ncbi:MAG: TldD/PmbA family protein, partial [Oligoflexia bacterium]|nr:TldD/PmbA family protein [Oligoflexia bacterium]
MDNGLERELLGLATAGVDAALAAGADQAEAYVSATRQLKVAFAKNDIDSVGSNRETTLGIRVIKDHRLGFVTTNNPATLQDTAKNVVAMAKASPPDEMNGLPQPQVVPETAALVHPDLASLDAESLAKIGSEALAMVLGLRDPRLPDARLTIDMMGLEVSDKTHAVVSSTGVRQAHRSAAASGDIFGMGILDAVPGSFSYDGDAVRDPAKLAVTLDRAFRRFAKKCFGALGATAGDSFRGPILIPADALGEFLVGHLAQALSADSVRQGTSPFAGRLGQ